VRRYSSKTRQIIAAVLSLAPLIFVLTSWSAVAYSQDVPSCSGVSNILIGSTTYAPEWCDEFTGAAGPPSTTVWSYNLGNNSGWGNNELEVYCGPPGYASNPSQCPSTFSTSTAPAYIDGNGHLVIQAINENGAWLSTRMTTEGLENFTYGILEASIQLPNTTDQGVWPAFWTLGSDISSDPWPACGEADIMENWSPQVYNGAGTTGNNSTIHTTETGGDGIGERFTFPSGQATDTAFHTYGVVWSENEMQFFVDDPTSPFFTATPGVLPSGDTWPFNQPIFAILNVAVGGTLGGSDASLTSPQLMQVGYVRWYTPVSCAAVPSAPTGLAATASSTSAIGLSWTAVTPPADCTVSSYNVYGSTISGFTPSSSNLIASGVTGTTYSNTGLTASTTYYYVVEAVDASGGSAASAQASATTQAPAPCAAAPSAPTGLAAAATSSSAIGLNWTAETPPANCTISSYSVYGSTTSGFTPSSGNLIASGLTTTSYTDSGLTASTTYYYVVESLDTIGASPASSQASATTSAPPVASFTLGVAPASLTITAGASGTEAVTVTPVNGFPTTSTITFACSNLPANASCSFAPTSVQGGNIVSTLTVNTTTSAALHFNCRPLFPAPALAVALCFLGWKKRRGVQIMLLLAVSVIGLSLFNGCGGSSKAPPVPSTVTVTATSGALQQNATFSLMVQ
jgi:beta-glucanase (GH16 family)